MILLAWLALACAEKEEVGYIFSEGRRRFLTRDGVNIVASRRGEKPAKFKMVKMEGEYSHSVLVYPVPPMDEKKVADFAYNSKEWYFYPEHQKWNQRPRFVLMPGNVVKIVVGDTCIAVDKEDKVVGETCKSDKDDKYQLFSWVPRSQKRRVDAWVRRSMYMRDSDDRDEADSDRRGPSRGGDRHSDSGYESDSNDGGYYRRGRKPFQDAEYDSRGPGGHGPFNSGIGFFGGGRRRRHGEYDDFSPLEDCDDEGNEHRAKEGYHLHEARMLRRRRGVAHARSRRARHSRPFGSREYDAGAWYGRDMQPVDGGSESGDYLGDQGGIRRGHESISDEILEPYSDKHLYRGLYRQGHVSDGMGFADGIGYCSMGDPGENEICKINRTTMAFRRMVGIPI